MIYCLIKRSAKIQRTASSKKYFTLIELLVVLSIIIVLSSFLIIVLNQVKTKVKRKVCQNNLEQVGVAMNSHASDNNGWAIEFSSYQYNMHWQRYIYCGFESSNGGNKYTGMGQYLDLRYLDNEAVYYCPERDWDPKNEMTGSKSNLTDYNFWVELSRTGRHSQGVNSKTENPKAKRLYQLDPSQGILVDYLATAHWKNNGIGNHGNYYNGMTAGGSIRSHEDDDDSINTLSNSSWYIELYNSQGLHWVEAYNSFKKVYNEIMTGENCL